MPATAARSPASSPAAGWPDSHHVGGQVQLRVRHPPGRAVPLGQPQAQPGRAVQPPGDRGPQFAGVELALDQDDLAGVPGHGLVLQGEDAQILPGQRLRNRHGRRTPHAEVR